jgi:signal transduction histidine kinase
LDHSRGGLGLGLAIVKGIAELHHGSATATSAGPGQGCEVKMLPPLLIQPEPSKTVSPSSSIRLARSCCLDWVRG